MGHLVQSPCYTKIKNWATSTSVEVLPMLYRDVFADRCFVRWLVCAPDTDDLLALLADEITLGMKMILNNEFHQQAEVLPSY